MVPRPQSDRNRSLRSLACSWLSSPSWKSLRDRSRVPRWPGDLRPCVASLPCHNTVSLPAAGLEEPGGGWVSPGDSSCSPLPHRKGWWGPWSPAWSLTTTPPFLDPQAASPWSLTSPITFSPFLGGLFPFSELSEMLSDVVWAEAGGMVGQGARPGHILQGLGFYGDQLPRLSA